MSFECDWVSSKLDDGHLIFVWKQRHIIATINDRKTIIRNTGLLFKFFLERMLHWGLEVERV